MYTLVHMDCLEWMAGRPANTVSAIVTDPPYAIQEYSAMELRKKRNGRGGIWRIPPSFDGHQRQALPRFSVINDDAAAREEFAAFFTRWGRAAIRVLAPGAHVIIATTPLLSDILGCAMRSAGFERRGEIVRLVSTLRGGDRPKGAEQEFQELSVMPRAAWEPWGVYRKPLSERTVAQNLRKWGTGALRRPSPDTPFSDVITVGRTPQEERSLSGHPSQKPLDLMLRLTHAALPLGTGLLLEPFLGSGSTVAAAETLCLESIGIEQDSDFHAAALESIPKMVAFLKKRKGEKQH